MLAGVLRVFAHLAGSRAPGDVWLLAGVHLLTAIGFALLVSRADPLRDTLLVVRYTTRHCRRARRRWPRSSLVDFRKAAFLRLSYLPLVGGAGPVAAADAVWRRARDAAARGSISGRCSRSKRSGCCSPFSLPATSRERWELLRQLRSRTIGNRRVPAWLHAAATRVRAAGRRRRRRGAAVLRPAEGSRPGAVPVPACSWRCMPSRAPASAMAVAGVGLLAVGFVAGYRLNISSTLTARVADVAIAVGQRGARRRSDRAVDLGGRHRRVVGHRSRLRRHALSAGRPYRSGARGDRRRARTDRPRRDRGRLRLDRRARLAHRLACGHRLRVLPRHRGDVVSRDSRRSHGGRGLRPDPAHRRRHAVSQLRRLRDGGQSRRAWRADGD